jgi:CheY-like chemotaxis protein
MPRTLLLADDSVTIQRVIELTFADENIKVIAVGDGDQAIERIEASPPDIVLADVGMPGRSGYEVAQHMKQSPRLSTIPIILLTGAFEPVDQARAAEAGCDGVLAKPFEPQLVIARVKELLAKRGLAAEPAPPKSKPIEEELAAASSLPPLATQSPASKGADVDDYFDRLDAAFASLSKAPKPPLPSAETDDSIDWPGDAESSAAAADRDEWDIGPIDLPVDTDDLPLVEPQRIIAPPPVRTSPRTTASTEAAPAPVPAVPAPAATAAPLERVSLADAFAALLDAEQRQRPAAAVALSIEAPPVLDDLVERAAERTLARMHDTIARLVREEIDRIKPSNS